MQCKKDYLKIHVKHMYHITLYGMSGLKDKYAKIVLTNKKMVQDLYVGISRLIKYGKSLSMALFLGCKK